ncbi:DUF2878 domain-containing protein [Halopseudomonas laoshanensis]|uniref:DUF2878 domain-containing protein n=1 Tax=Halopseudomonas laoshanensis TaxID=2268758 RepID=A0A7V7KVC2_9GAMM|nr:DUF2878 domain-containing protein [Halopseudomonas laoshanensis]KAA0692381.1 DUF2878 domain-containing protein [Halopseudomonas laoshanensis]
MPVKLIANALLFQAGWFACVLGGTSVWLLVPLAALIVHFTWISSWAAEGKLVVSVMLAGAALDSFLLQMGVFQFTGEPLLAPLWLVLLWAMLGTTLNHCLAWSAKPLWMACVLGAIAGPFSYFAGAALAEVRLPLGTQLSAVILAICWAIMYPLLHGFAHLYREQFRLRQLSLHKH